MISIKQRAFYLTASYPYYAFGLAILLFPYLQLIQSKFQSPILLKRLNTSLILILISALVFCVYIKGSIGRDKESVMLMRELQDKVPYNIGIGIVPGMDNDHALKAYLSRYHKIITTIYYDRCNVVLQDRSMIPDSSFKKTMELYRAEELSTRYILWEKAY
jgi:hypothetical protein